MAKGKGVDLAAKDRQERLDKKCKKEVNKWKWTGQLEAEDFRKGGALVAGLVQEAGKELAKGEEGRREVGEVEGRKEVQKEAGSLQLHLVGLSLDEEDGEGPFLSFPGRIRDCATDDEEEEEGGSGNEEDTKQNTKGDEDETKEDEGANLVERCAGFQGCDSSCEVEDLTPYQGTKRCLGEYHCACGLRWRSASSSSNRSQRCRECAAEVFPHWQRPLEDWESRAVSLGAHRGHPTACRGPGDRSKRKDQGRKRGASMKSSRKMNIAK